MLQLLIIFRSHHNLVHIQLYEWWHPLHSCAITCAWHPQIKCGFCFRRVRGGFVCVGGRGGGRFACLPLYLLGFAIICAKGPTWLGWVFSLPHEFVGFLGIHHTPSPLCWLAWHATCTHIIVGFPDISIFRLNLSSIFKKHSMTVWFLFVFLDGPEPMAAAFVMVCRTAIRVQRSC